MKEGFIVKRKLENSIMPYMLCVQHLKWSRTFIFYHVYDYSKEAVTLFAGYGLSTPIFNSFNTGGFDLTSASTQIPLISIILGVGIGILRFVYGRENVVQRVIGQKKLMKNMKVLNAKVMQTLSDGTNMLPEMILIQKELLSTVNISVQEDVYSFDRCFDDENLNKAKAETTRILNRFQAQLDQTATDEVAEEVPDQIVTPK